MERGGPAPGEGGGLFDSPVATRSVLVTHAFVAGGKVSESERPLSVGGAGTVTVSAFEGWSYVALGHLHRPQTAGGDHIHYSGSLFPYSFDETGQAKLINMVEIDGRGAVRVEGVPLRPRREVRRISGHLTDLLRAGPASGAGDYLMVTLLDDGPVHDAMGRLREVYPNILHLERAGLLGGAGAHDSSDHGGPGGNTGRDHRRFTERELFTAFHRDVTGSELTPGEDEVLDSVLEELARREREVPA